MRVHNKVAAAAVVASLGAGLVVPTQAGAVIEQKRSFSVDAVTNAVEGFQRVEVNKGRVSWLTYNNPSYGTMSTAFYLDAFAGGSKLPFAGDATAVQSSSEGDTDTITMTHTANGVEVIRTFTVTPDQVDVEVKLRNVSGSTQNLGLNLTTGLMAYDYDITAKQEDTGYDLSVGGRYNLQTRYGGADAIGTGDSQASAVNGANNDGRFQAAKWSQSVPAGGELKATATVSGNASESLQDSDGDGFPDEWELNGYTAADGTALPLHRWGADPERKDLFLQLNWMKSEWETNGCSEKRDFAPTEADFERFLECSRANTNVYRPSRETLNDLVDLFDKKGYNLHIDAGAYYSNIPGIERHGGQTVDYAPYYFDGEVPGIRLLSDRRNLLGPRQSVFRVGVIGDMQDRGNLSSGNALVSDGAFYVAKNYLMTSQDQVRNTILHEFGHNLGLTHSGASSVEKPNSAYVPKYVSVMNYLYQFSHFDYSDKDSSSSDNVATPQACLNGTSNCYTGAYDIKADWQNLDLVNGEIKKANGSTGVDEQSLETLGKKHPTVRDLEVMAAEQNNGKAGLRVMNEKKNVIIANRSDSKVNIELANLGIDLHKFTLQVNYPGGKFRKEYPIEGAITEYSKLPVEVPIANTAGYTDSTMPVQFRVYNEEGKLVEDQTIDFSVLNYTTQDMDKLVKELKAKKSALLADAKDTVAKKDPAAPTLSKAAPIPTATQQPSQPGGRNTSVTEFKPTPEPSVNKPVPQRGDATGNQTGAKAGGGGGSIGAIVGIIIAILALVGLGGAAAATMG